VEHPYGKLSFCTQPDAIMEELYFGKPSPK
jgi:hypothetical protein